MRVATGRARFELTGTAAVGETWIVTLDGRTFRYVVASGDDLADVVAGLVGCINAPTTGCSTGSATGFIATLDPASATATAFIVERNSAFYTDFAITPDTRGTAAVRIEDGAAVFELGGFPAMGEVWSLTIGAVTKSVTVEFREDLASIASRLATALLTTTRPRSTSPWPGA